MRYKEFEINEEIDNVDLGHVTLVRRVRIDTTNDDEAREFAEKYAEEHGVKIFVIGKGLHRWYTGCVGRLADFYM